MTQSRYSVLVSLCLLLVLAAGFFLASRVAYNKLHSTIAAAIATATVVVLPPTPTRPPITPTPRGTRTRPTPAADATSTPAAGSVQVLIGTTQNPSSAGTTFPGGTGVFYCMVNLPNVPESAPITFKWLSLPARSVLFPYTGTYSGPFKYSYFTGPLASGQYGCEVSAPVNGSVQVVGTGLFTVK